MRSPLHYRPLPALAVLLAITSITGAAQATDRQALAYERLKQRITVQRQQLLSGCGWRCRRKLVRGALEKTVLRRVDQLFAAWLGTRWGLGMPQTFRPGQGKVNCGMFVALVLRHAGFNLPVYKLNRQAARHAILSLSPRKSIRYFHNAPMKRFLARVRRMGPGLYLIGLDFHIGFLRLHPKGKLRFVHASYVTHTVVDEPAATASPIVTSKYRVVGKLLQPNMLRAWVNGRRIHVLGPR